MVRERAHGSQSSALLASAHCAGRNEQTSVLAPKGTGLPLPTSRVPESLPLSWEVAVTRGDTLGTLSMAALVRDLGGEVKRTNKNASYCSRVLGSAMGMLVSFGGAYILSRTSCGRVSLIWKMSTLPPASLMPAASASASCLMWPHVEY